MSEYKFKTNLIDSAEFKLGDNGMVVLSLTKKIKDDGTATNIVSSNISPAVAILDLITELESIQNYNNKININVVNNVMHLHYPMKSKTIFADDIPCLTKEKLDNTLIQIEEFMNTYSNYVDNLIYNFNNNITIED